MDNWRISRHRGERGRRNLERYGVWLACLSLLWFSAGCASFWRNVGVDGRSAERGGSSPERAEASGSERSPVQRVVEQTPAQAPAVLAPQRRSKTSRADAAPDVARPSEGPRSVPHPLADVSDAELDERLRHDLESLGSISIGRPNGGKLLNAVQLPADPRWELVDPAHAWGTAETIEYLRTSIAAVHERFPATPPLHVGHISRRSGGYLSPHRSHQSGRDVDLGYYYKRDHDWYRRATRSNLDLDRTWTLVRSLITETDVRLILIDIGVQRLLREHAERIGEDPAWLDDIFRGNGSERPPLIRHEPGHATHIHVRFYNPVAQETARRCYAKLIELGRIKPPVHYIKHRARKGDTLIGLAKRYGTTVRAIRRANGLRSSTIYAKKFYKIPRRGPAAAGPRVEVPPRRLPPDYQRDTRQTRNEQSGHRDARLQ